MATMRGAPEPRGLEAASTRGSEYYWDLHLLTGDEEEVHCGGGEARSREAAAACYR